MRGLLSSHTWAKIVVLLLSLKIPHARSSGVPFCSDAHDFPGYPFVNVATKFISIKNRSRLLPLRERPRIGQHCFAAQPRIEHTSMERRKAQFESIGIAERYLK